MHISRTAKESLKLAAALVTVYAIAMSINWEKPFWGGFAVIVCSQANLGQSLNRAILWMLGTLFAMLGGWIIVALFPQDRWLFMIALSIWVSACVYFIQRSRYQYFWITCGYVILMLWDATGGDLSISYEEGILRVQESLLGIVVYGLFAVLVWPNCSSGELQKASAQLLDSHRIFAASCFSRLKNKEKLKINPEKRVDLLKVDARLRSSISDASSDSYEVWESRKQWDHFGSRATAVTQSLLKLEESLALSSNLGISNFLVGVNDYVEDMQRRFDGIKKGVANSELVDTVEEKAIFADIEKIKGISTFDTAALSVTRRSLNDLEVESRSLIDSVNDIKNLGDSYSKFPAERGAHWFGFFMPDPDRLANVVRVLVGIWIAYLAYLFVPDMLGGLLVVLLITIIAILAAMSPQIKLFETCFYTILVCLMSAPLYFFVMPKLHGFYSLGVMIFIWTFVISYFAVRVFGPQSMIRTLVLIFPQIVFNFNNYQEYSFAVYTNYLFVLAIIFCILAVSRNIPFSSHPERNFKNNIDRFLNSAACLVLEGDIPDYKKQSIFYRVYILYHLNIVSISHKNVLYWKDGIDEKCIRGMSGDQIARIVDLLMLISNQVQILYRIDKCKMNLIATKRMLREAFIWRCLAGKIFFYLSGKKRNIHIDALRRGYRRIFERANVDVSELMELRACSKESKEGVSNFLYFLGVAHCINNYLAEFFRLSESVDWECFCEEKCL
ncbi:FUSC family protein [Microbulbifer sp. OS29]|uniref:FUSC family protein n=1 Tax=Microbulbifer okhotskensis TaxID=2926617 RepID=A0A9X2EVA3_9GAMM|nr:FUSC family protein [Microbulbifer okhotskensis]MCO1336593.1 FUSC family protein [Microbulbifer okhotskensis]